MLLRTLKISPLGFVGFRLDNPNNPGFWTDVHLNWSFAVLIMKHDIAFIERYVNGSIGPLSEHGFKTIQIKRYGLFGRDAQANTYY